MDLNDVKKALYKQKPMAKLLYVRKGDVLYQCTLTNNEDEFENIHFNIPVSDMGDSDFLPEMEAKLLARWIVTKESVE